MFEFTESAIKRFSERDIREALSDPALCSTGLEDSPVGHARRMYIGRTWSEVTLEVGIEFLPGGVKRVFHARKASTHWKRLARYES